MSYKLPISHCFPINPGGQRQTELLDSITYPPFKQGFVGSDVSAEKLPIVMF